MGKDVAHLTLRDVRSAQGLKKWLESKYTNSKIAHAAPRKAGRTLWIGGLPDPWSTKDYNQPWFLEPLQKVLETFGPLQPQAEKEVDEYTAWLRAVGTEEKLFDLDEELAKVEEEKKKSASEEEGKDGSPKKKEDEKEGEKKEGDKDGDKKEGEDGEKKEGDKDGEKKEGEGDKKEDGEKKDAEEKKDDGPPLKRPEEKKEEKKEPSPVRKSVFDDLDKPKPPKYITYFAKGRCMFVTFENIQDAIKARNSL
jgi:hypothetical protein